MNQDPLYKFEFQNPKSEIGGWDSEFGFGTRELSAEDREAIRDWLGTHPEEAAQLPDLENLVRLYRQTPASEPSDKAWGDLLVGVMAQMSTCVQGKSRPEAQPRNKNLEFGQRWLRAGFMGTAAAAAILLAVALPHGKQSSIPPTVDNLGPPDASIPVAFRLDALPILNSDDVDLESIKGNDSTLLVVGRPPLMGPLVLVGMGDVTLDSVEPDDDGMVPKVRMNSGPDDSPMIVAPIRELEAKDSDAK